VIRPATGLACLLLVSCGGGRAKEAPQKPGGPWLKARQIEEGGLSIGVVGEHQVDRRVVAAGRVSFDDLRVTHVFSPVTGRVVEVLAEPGAKLQAGSPLAVLSSPDLGQAYSDFLKAQADVAAMQKEYERQKELFDAHAGAKRDLEAAENNFRKAQAELDRSRGKARLLAPDAAENNIQAFTLRSPIAGEVITRSVNPGMEVQGQYSGGTAVELFTIGELDRVWVLADVYEVDLARIKKKAAVAVKVVSYPERTFRGNVDWISGALDPNSHTARVRCVIENSDGALRPEMYATVEIAIEGRRALAVPRTAILRLGDQTVVFLEKERAQDGSVRFERRVVTLGDDGSGEFVPVSGVAAGDRIVTAGAILLAGLS